VAFVAQYRFALDFLDRLDRDPGLDALLDEPVPELGLPAGTYARAKLRFLNVARATEFAALAVLSQKGTQAPELRAAIEEDSARIWQAGRGRGEMLTVKNALRVVQQAGFAAWFPVQAGVAQSMARSTLWRSGRALISAAQLEAITPRLEPGDILLVRRNSYLSDIGLPGYWPHAALYVGTPEERRRLFVDPETQAWVRTQGQPDGAVEALLRAAHVDAYTQHLALDAGRPRRVLEAISEGVVFHSLEHLTADSLAVLRPRLTRTERAAALVRAFGYAGRPYDFDFDFRTDAAIVCTELVYKAYEPVAGFRGVAWSVPQILGRPVIPANEFARQFDAAFGTPAQQLDLIVFLDGQERAGVAIERSVEAFRESWRRPKWQFLTSP